MGDMTMVLILSADTGHPLLGAHAYMRQPTAYSSELQLAFTG